MQVGSALEFTLTVPLNSIQITAVIKRKYFY